MFHSKCITVLMVGLILSGCGSGTTEAPAEPPAGTSPAITPPTAKTARIMPLGDSITESAAGQSSYRYYLWHLALDRRYDVNFVGSQHGVFGGASTLDDFDKDHEGHWGWRTHQILAQIQDWASTAAPDFVLIHLGTNDLWDGRDIPMTVRDLGNIIDQLQLVNSRIGIVLAQIIPAIPPGVPQLPTFNALLPALVASKNLATSPVVLVDQFTGFDPVTMTWDGAHPNAIGEARMANRWFAALAPLLERFYASP